jgi:hypothetical protein
MFQGMKPATRRFGFKLRVDEFDLYIPRLVHPHGRVRQPPRGLRGDEVLEDGRVLDAASHDVRHADAPRAYGVLHGVALQVVYLKGKF